MRWNQFHYFAVITVFLDGICILALNEFKKMKDFLWDFPGSPVVKTLHFNCTRHRFSSLVGELGL